MKMKVKIVPGKQLSALLKGQQCGSGCFLLEELGDKREAARLAAARSMPAPTEAIVVTIGTRPRRTLEEHLLNPARWNNVLPMGPKDTIGAQALYEAGMRATTARRNADNSEYIKSLEIL